MNRVLNTVCALAATTLVVAGCTDYESATNLNPAGPPMVQQVRMKETYTTPGSTDLSTRRVFGFGTHPDAADVEQHAVTSASVSGNSFRVIMDELLVGNNLEEIRCRSTVDTDAYSRVPLTATPDDIAKCATAQDVLPSTCKGANATCLCELDGGCSVGTETIVKGAPVGVDDKNQDGAADDTHLIAGSVGIKCGTINVPIDGDLSYWNPSGNQQPPAMGGFEALGPAIVLIPQAGLPTNLPCQLTFGTDVVDKQGERVCATAGGDINATCTPGDTSAVSFKTEPLTFTSVSFANNQTGVSRTDPATFVANTALDPTAIAGITVTQGGVAFNGFTVALGTMNKVLTITWTGAGLAANTVYAVTITTQVKDTFMQPVPAAIVTTFTTGA